MSGADTIELDSPAKIDAANRLARMFEEDAQAFREKTELRVQLSAGGVRAIVNIEGGVCTERHIRRLVRWLEVQADILADDESNT